MTATIQTVLLLLAVLVVVGIIARRFNAAPSILLVVAGILLALTPGLPPIELAPELVLLGILPPLIYSAGVAMSWREFRFNLRPIALLAFGYVVFTTGAVAAAAHWLLGMPLAVAFVLGAIVTPTDAVAPVSIMRQMGVPRRLIVILEGEGLANDATALILYRFAVAAAGTGLFSLGQAAGTFVLIVVGEIAFGIGIGWLSLRLRRWTRDPRVEITLSLLTPYVAFLIPAHLGGSGVLATMTAGCSRAGTDHCSFRRRPGCKGSSFGTWSSICSKECWLSQRGLCGSIRRLIYLAGSAHRLHGGIRFRRGNGSSLLRLSGCAALFH